MKHIKVTNDLYWLGVKDPDLRIFDIIVETKYGSTYNSYLLKGSEHNVIVDTVKLEFLEEFLIAVEELVSFQAISYIIVNHTEPDHAGSIQRMLELNPNITLVGSATAIKFLKEIINQDFKAISVKENDTLSLGDKTLQFWMLPNLHWPDTMLTYWIEEKVVFSCDFFGSHYCPSELFLSALSEQERAEHREALKHYYDCIMAPFPSFVTKGLRRMDGVEVKLILTGHGPILDTAIEDIKQRYESYVVPAKREVPLVVIPYVSAYGYTRMLANKIAEGVMSAGKIDVRLYDMIDSNFDDVMKDIDLADGILLGSPTILSDALKPIWDIATTMLPVTHGGKLASAFGSYGWTGEAVPVLIERLKHLRMKVIDGYRVRFKPSVMEEEEAVAYGQEFGKQLLVHVESKRK